MNGGGTKCYNGEKYYPLLQNHSEHQLTEFQRMGSGASLMVQRLRIRLPMQGTQVRALVWEDPTCRGAAGPVSHND